MAVFWLLLSGLFKSQLLILGVISVAITVYFSMRMEVLEHRDQEIYFPFIKILPYWCWLFIEIFKSNIDVTKMILRKDLAIKPILKAIPSTQKTEIGRVIYANSITLTPGTVAINIAKDGDVIVHALHKESIEALERGEMSRRVTRLEKTITNPLKKRKSDSKTESDSQA